MEKLSRRESEINSGLQIIVLLCHTVFSLVLIGEALFLGWEIWALFLVGFNLIACWVLHIRQFFTGEIRLWVFEGTQMVMFFFYGVHSTSFFDLTPIILIAIFVYTMTYNRGMINLAFSTFALTVAYDLVVMLSTETEVDPLILTRIILHVAIVAGSCWVSYSFIEKAEREKEEVERQLFEMADANRRSEDFLTNVSHELRTPINAVTGISEVLLKGNVDARTHAGLSAIREAGKRLYGQISDILDYTEIGAEKLVISEDQYSISSIVNDLIADYEYMSHSFEVELLFDVDVNVPSVLMGDGRMIKKVIMHLIDNSLKFTDKGVVCVRITAPVKEYGVNLDIEVIDTGKGIDPKDIPNITSRYYQADSTRTREAGGLGLGLSIVMGIVVSMRGFYYIKSDGKSGTSIHISIPQKVVDPEPCISVSGREDYRIGFYLRQEVFVSQEHWDYYNRLVAHLADGIGLDIRRMSSAEEIRDLTEKGLLTHLYTGQQEYMINPDFFEEISGCCQVIVITGGEVQFPRTSNIRQIRIPISAFSITQALREEMNVGEDAELFGMGRMYCPGVRALVVDDEEMNLVVAKGILKDYKITVETASSGAEAIEKCTVSNYDIIFMDHMMPQMDGVEAAKRIRRLSTEKKQVIVALTANAVSGAREMFLSEGFDEFISKPIELTVLERVLRKVLPASSINYVMEEKREEQQHDALFDPGFSSLPKPASTVSFGAVESTAKPLAPRSAFIKSLSDMGLDADAALSACRGDEEFYKDLLGIFTDEAEAMAESGDVAGISSFSELIGLASGEVSEARIMTMVRGIRTVLGKH